MAINATITDSVEFCDMERAPLALLNPAMLAPLRGRSTAEPSHCGNQLRTVLALVDLRLLRRPVSGRERASFANGVRRNHTLGQLRGVLAGQKAITDNELAYPSA